jgi:hypothetical protein
MGGAARLQHNVSAEQHDRTAVAVEVATNGHFNGHSGPVVLLGGYIVLEPRSATHYLLSDQKTRLVEGIASSMASMIHGVVVPQSKKAI